VVVGVGPNAAENRASMKVWDVESSNFVLLIYPSVIPAVPQATAEGPSEMPHRRVVLLSGLRRVVGLGSTTPNPNLQVLNVGAGT